MDVLRFDRIVKASYVCAILYIYIFIMLDVFHLNPENEGDFSFFALLPPILFPMLVAIFYIIFGGMNGRYRKTKIVLFFIWLGFFSLFIIPLDLTDSLLISIITPILWGMMPVIPLIAYLLYKKFNKSKALFVLSAAAMCVAALTTYPAKNYLQKINGDSCASEGLIVRQYAGPASFYQKVHGDVVCITVDRGYPSETYKWKVFDIADANTFEYIGEGYSRDKNYIFYEGVSTDADPETFVMDANWKVDEMQNFIRGGTQYKRDAYNVYFKGEKVQTKNIDQFEIVDLCDSYRCATDGSSVFKNGKVIENINLSELTFLHSCEYAKDDTRVYHAGEIIEGADANTFGIYGENQYCYAYDKSHTYYEGKVVPDAISTSKLRKINEADPFSPYTDGNNIYFDGKKLDIDMDNFKYLGKSVSKDGRSVYFRDKKIVGADPSTFELVLIDSLNMCAKDKNNRYFDGKVYNHPMCKW